MYVLFSLYNFGEFYPSREGFVRSSVVRRMCLNTLYYLRKVFSCFVFRHWRMTLFKPSILHTHLRQGDSKRSRFYYTYADGNWQETKPEETNPRSFSTLRLMTWNVNHRAKHAESRMEHAIDHLKDIATKTMPEVPTVIFLQEIMSCTLEVAKGTSWIQDHFRLMDINPHAHWLFGHGTLTIVDRRLPIISAWRVPYENQTKQGRDASFIDLNLEHRVTKTPFRLRLCNTHLESFKDYSLRHQQLALVNQHLRADSIHAGVVAGDLNATRKSRDQNQHLPHGLTDAFSGPGKGYTWGMQSSNWSAKGYHGLYPCKRLDKILFCGNIMITDLKTFGRHLRTSEAKVFVSDHLGVMAKLEII